MLCLTRNNNNNLKFKYNRALELNKVLSFKSDNVDLHTVPNKISSLHWKIFLLFICKWGPVKSMQCMIRLSHALGTSTYSLWETPLNLSKDTLLLLKKRKEKKENKK